MDAKRCNFKSNPEIKKDRIYWMVGNNPTLAKGESTFHIELKGRGEVFLSASNKDALKFLFKALSDFILDEKRD